MKNSVILRVIFVQAINIEYISEKKKQFIVKFDGYFGSAWPTFWQTLLHNY